MSHIKIARDFTTAPGGRKRAWGPHSAEEFLETLLLPRFDEARRLGEPLCIDLDGTQGYAASFLDEAFTGLARARGYRTVMSQLMFASVEEPQLIDDIYSYIKETR